MGMDAAITANKEMDVSNPSGRVVEVRVPASTSNLGAGFDCFGLALQLYLTVRARLMRENHEMCRIRSRGEDSSAQLPRTTENLVYRALRFAAEQQGVNLPPVRLAVHNEIPLGRGLGSSAAAIIAGLKLCAVLCECEISDETILQYATEFEGHADNVAASLYGGWVVTCIKRDWHVLAVKRRWPSDIKVLIVSPQLSLDTMAARAALPRAVDHTDAVYNLQRVALFGAALEERRYDLLWESMQDCLHQPHRQSLVPGLSEALATRQLPGLLGVALSGAGPSVLALAHDCFHEIGEAIAEKFRQHNIEASVRLLKVDENGTLAGEHIRRRFVVESS